MPQSPDPTGDATDTAIMTVPTVTVSEHGPYVVTGLVQVQDSGGRVVATPPDGVYLCRCGLSATKPFCDGSHARSGFDGSLAG